MLPTKASLRRVCDAQALTPEKNGRAPLNDQVYQTDQRYPVVRFENGMQYLCSPIDFEAEGLRGNVEARRVQASAVRLHMCQSH